MSDDDDFSGPHRPPKRKDFGSALNPPKLYRQMGMTTGGKDVTREERDTYYRGMKRAQRRKLEQRRRR